MSIFSYNGQAIEYTVKRSKRKTIGIKISPIEGIILCVPTKCSEATIQHVLKEKATWILSKVNLVNMRKDLFKDREYKSGESLKLLDDNYPLTVIDGDYKKCSARFDKSGFTVLVNTEVIKSERNNLLKQALSKLYREIGKQLLAERTNYYAGVIGVKPNRITIKEQKSVWGSCSSKNNINYNWKIIMAPLCIVDYIVVHELCHLVHANHSKEYWRLVEQIMPKYKEYKDWLKGHGLSLDLDKIVDY